ncbi:methyl methanesulfonate-sensitivity protein 22 [Earliella scabrosa]|nr:methyl methanesulfonate-sensitivity protein 22 [Earliella scabrosa]
MYRDVLRVKREAVGNRLLALEQSWKSIFTLCGLSQFSIHGHSSMTPRIPHSWQTIVFVLEQAPLNHVTTGATKADKVNERMRAQYVRVLLSRCFWLHLKWQWRLEVHEAVHLFNRLNQFFKERNFVNLVDEQSDFPSFLRYHNIGLLQEKKSSDTAFTLFLKMVVRAAEDLKKPNPQLAESNATRVSLTKLISLMLPVGNLSTGAPLTDHDRSMLYNRYSAVVVAIYLDPTEANRKRRLSLARQYVDFKFVDHENRRACIRGAMHLAIILRHLALPLDDILDWLKEMTETLVQEYQKSDASKVPSHEPKVTDRAVTSIQLLLGCVRRVLMTSSMNPDHHEHKYPDPTLLQGPWVTEVFSKATNLSTISSTGDEIRRLVQAFLDARSLVIPKRRRPQRRVVVDESQDSQDYGHFELDMNDPALIAALDGGVSNHDENQEKEKVVCEIIETHISPAIYRLVCKHFNDPVYHQTTGLSFPLQTADRWIDCWVGCISVSVQNGRKEWSFFLDYGPQSWEKIIEPDWRRRVGLRFMFMVLQLDPPAYLDVTNRFVDVLFESMATPKVTIEHEYASLLFSIDCLRHPLFLDLPIDPPGEDNDYHLSKHQFIENRLAILDTMLKNMSNAVNAAEASRNQEALARSGIYCTSVTKLLSTLKDICERYPLNSQARASYVAFCKEILDVIARYPAIHNQTRDRGLAILMTWLRNVS